MIEFDPASILGTCTDSPSLEEVFHTLETFRRPRIDGGDDGKWFDWLLVRHKGVELGFVDKAYFEARPEHEWGAGASVIFQVYLYASDFNGNREILAYEGQLPCGLQLTDARAQARERLNIYGVRESQQTDCWDTEKYRLHIRYAPSENSIESVILSLPLHPFPEGGRIPCAVSCQDWINLFGSDIDSRVMDEAVAPLDIRQRMLDFDDGRKADFTFESGFEMCFEDRLNSNENKSRNKQGLVLVAVKFFRARDGEARQWAGELPCGLSFNDSPLRVLEKVQAPPAIKEEGRLTGFFLWHFNTHSLRILYSTFDNQILRVTLMAPGYWTTPEK